MKHFISLKDLSKKEILTLISESCAIKKNPLKFKNKLKGKYVGLLFEKPSLRTKTAFYIGSLQLGASPVYYSHHEIKLEKRETISDVSRTLSNFLDGIVSRTFSHNTILELAKFSSIPVINGLSDFLHPSQVLADLITIYELKGDIKKLKVAYIGDGNNVCHSLIQAFSILGGNLCVATPKEYSPSRNIVMEAKNHCSKSGAKINLMTSIQEAAMDADVLYTDAWVSMGREKERQGRKKAFKEFQINDKILKLAKKDAIVMHCLPAHRGEEITDSVIESKNSVVFAQAQNRLYSAKAILLYCLGQN